MKGYTISYPTVLKRETTTANEERVDCAMLSIKSLLMTILWSFEFKWCDVNLWKRRVWFFFFCFKRLWQWVLLECECSPPRTSMRLRVGQLPLGLADSRCMANARPFSFSVNHDLIGCFYNQISVNSICVSKFTYDTKCFQYSFVLSDTLNWNPIAWIFYETQ